MCCIGNWKVFPYTRCILAHNKSDELERQNGFMNWTRFLSPILGCQAFTNYQLHFIYNFNAAEVILMKWVHAGPFSIRSIIDTIYVTVHPIQALKSQYLERHSQHSNPSGMFIHSQRLFEQLQNAYKRIQSVDARDGAKIAPIVKSHSAESILLARRHIYKISASRR